MAVTSEVSLVGSPLPQHRLKVLQVGVRLGIAALKFLLIHATSLLWVLNHEYVSRGLGPPSLGIPASQKGVNQVRLNLCGNRLHLSLGALGNVAHHQQVVGPLGRNLHPVDPVGPPELAPSLAA